MAWFSPKCPVTDNEKAWVEHNLLWFLEQFGQQTFLDVNVILPTPAFFPDPFKGSEECVRRLVDRVCGYMQVAPHRVTKEHPRLLGMGWETNLCHPVQGVRIKEQRASERPPNHTGRHPHAPVPIPLHPQPAGHERAQPPRLHTGRQ